MTDLVPPTDGKITGRGSGMGSGVDVQSTIDLSDAEAGQTRLDWKADVVVGELFNCLKAQLEA